MAFENHSFKPTGLTAAADLSGNQFYAVKISGSLQVNLAGDGEEAYGILQNKPIPGEAAELCRLGQTKAISGAAFAAGAKLAVNAAGKLILAAAGKKQVAVALEAAGAADEVVTVDFLSAGYQA